MKINQLFKEYALNSTLHGAKFIVDDKYHISERLFWLICVIASWIASFFLMRAALDAFENNAISFVAETTYRDWETEFPSIVICESKNMDRVQNVSEFLWGSEHDFPLEEVLSEISYFRGESYHTIHECANDTPTPNCVFGNFSYYAKLVRSDCTGTFGKCEWNEKHFNCCDYFFPMETELGVCYGINSAHTINPKKVRLNMISNKFTGPGKIKMEVLTEANIYILAEEDVPTLVTPKSDMLPVTPYISYDRQISIRNIENDPETRDVSVEQRSCRYIDENILNVHKHYSYSACSVQCRKDQQLKICNCTSHLMPNTPDYLHCDITGLKCLNDHYEDLSVVIAKWSYGRKGVVCDCLPSCTEIDVSITLDARQRNFHGQKRPIATVSIGLASLPTERYRRNVVRGRLDLVVSMGGTAGLFVGASFLSFVEIIYYFTIRPYMNYLKTKQQQLKLMIQQKQLNKF